MSALANKDLLRKILDYASPTCKELTGDYKKCKPPFRYRNAVGKVRSCAQECFEHTEQWVTPLLQSLPTSFQVLSTKDGSVQTEGRIGYEHLRMLVYNYPDEGGVVVQWQQGPSMTKTRKEYYEPDSMHDAGIIIANLLKGQGYATRPVLQIVLPVFFPTVLPGKSEGTIRFPGNDAWQRFASLMDSNRLTIAF